MLTEKKRILTGDRPTGRLHIGHYIGSLQNRVKLQNEYDTLILIADIQALTTHFEKPQLIQDSIYEVAIDNLSVGLDPNKIKLVLQSKVPYIAELTIFLSMLVTVNVLRHNPTTKNEAANYGYDELTYGFLGYPVNQAADIATFATDLVPVGEDQIPHMELTRKLVRRFNEGYQPVLKEPQHLLSNCPRLVGLDGNSKMGKSLGNAIYLSDSAEVVIDKVKMAITDPARIKASDVGHPEVCMVNKYHQVFTSNDYNNICEMCRKGAIGCVACKKRLSQSINGLLEPFRQKRAYYEANLKKVSEIIHAGTEEACKIGKETLLKVKDAMHLTLKH